MVTRDHAKRIMVVLGMAVFVCICEGIWNTNGFSTTTQFASTLSEKAANDKQRQQKERLDILGYEIFEPSIPGLQRGQDMISMSYILERFGKPMKLETALHHYRDPDPAGPSHFKTLIWHYDGLLLEMGSHLTSDYKQIPDEVWMRRVVVSSPRYHLKHGLQIGQTASHFIDVLGGYPDYHPGGGWTYGNDNEEKIDEFTTLITPYDVHISVDKEDKVEKLEWTWWGD